ncbi:MAG: glycosyltransferase [Oscillospiraceae bacterium]|jgi:glycosyltransferase involved in cell wall biosynthesis|nr:glycosyltransferase [Oscillospiraceae bacterium]
MNITISIIIPTFGARPELKRAVESALNQDFAEFELIVVDDNPPTSANRQATRDMLAEYRQNSQFRYIECHENKGGAAARNMGIAKAQGEWIAFLDDDDYFLKNKLKEHLAFAQANPELDGSYCAYTQWGVQQKAAVCKDLAFGLLSQRVQIPTPTLFLRRSAMLEIGCFNPSYPRHQDIEMLVRFAEKHSLSPLQKNLTVIGQSDGKNELHGRELEALKTQFLNDFRGKISSLGKAKQKQIICSNYANLWADYLHRGPFGEMLRIYFKYALKYPIEFPKCCVRRVQKHLERGKKLRQKAGEQPQKRRIFVLASWFPTPKHPLYAPFVAEQSAALHELGYEVTVLSTELLSIKDWERPELSRRSLPGIELYQFILPIYQFGSQKLSVNLTKLIMNRLYKKAVKEQGKPDLIHVQASRFAGSAGAELAKREGIPCVLTEHFSAIIWDTCTPTEKECIKQTIKGSDKVIAVSPKLAQKLEEEYGAKSAEYVPNFIDTELFRRNPQPHEGFCFVCCCWLSARKAVDVLIRAFAECGEEFNNSSLKIVGDGGERAKLEALAAELGVGERVEFLGSRNKEEIAEIMNGCDCFVLPSRAETFGIVYIEALSCGLPVIATRCGGPEGFVTAENGILIDIDDKDALKKAMLAVKNGSIAYDSDKISRDTATSFGKEMFKGKMAELLDGLV